MYRIHYCAESSVDMYFLHYLYLYWWRLLGLNPLTIDNQTYRVSYRWLLLSFILSSCLVTGLVRILIIKYENGLSGRYVTDTQLFVRLAEQLLTITVIIICLINKYNQIHNLIALQEQLDFLERYTNFSNKFSYLHLYPVIVMLIYTAFLVSRLGFGFTTNTSLDTFLPQYISSMFVILSDYQIFMNTVHIYQLLNHWRDSFERVLLQLELGYALKVKIIMSYYWKFHDIVNNFNNCFGIQILTLLLFRGARLLASCYSLFLSAADINLYPFSAEQFSLEIFWLLLRINQLIIVVYPCEAILNQFNSISKKLFRRLQIISYPYENQERKLFLVLIFMKKTIQFTAIGLFSINLRLLLKVVAAILTYLFIVIDFQSTDIKEKIKHN